MNLGEKLKETLTSYIQGYESSSKRIIELIDKIEEFVKSSHLFKTVKEISETCDLSVLNVDRIYDEYMINGTNCDIQIWQKSKMTIQVDTLVKLIIYPADNKIVINVIDNWNQYQNIFYYDSDKKAFFKKIPQINKGYEKIVEYKLSRLLTVLKDDKLLDIATKKLINTIKKQ